MDKKQNYENRKPDENEIYTWLEDNLNRAAQKYGNLSNQECRDCNAIVDINAEKCPACGSSNLSGLFTDGKKTLKEA